MNKMTKTIILLTLAQSAFATVKEVKKSKIVYGFDNRHEVYRSTPENQKLANSTAGMIENYKMVKVNEHFVLPPESLGNDYGLCKDERFQEQSNAMICSGFLVGKDLLVTAGHCISNQARCNEVSWVFDYKIESDSKRVNSMIPASKVYKCSKVIEAKFSSEGEDYQDYALIQLDREVENRAPLKVRSKGKVSNFTRVKVIGHPSGLPTKITNGAKIVENSSARVFKTNLDAFGGNSGSAVFNSATGEVEGILVLGVKDYIYDENSKCMRVNYAPENITNEPNLGETVTRITEIKHLQQ